MKSEVPSHCLNCGALVEGNTQFCSHCGAAFEVAPWRRNGCLVGCLTAILGIFALSFGLVGTCFLFVGADTPTSAQLGATKEISWWGLGAMLVAGLCLWAIARLNK